MKNTWNSGSGFPGWIDSGGTRRTSAVRYTHPAAGRYGVCRAGQKPAIGLVPCSHTRVLHQAAVHETWWFETFAFGTPLSLALLYRRRVRGFEKEQRVQQEFSRLLMESQEQERKRIAGELHDSLGQNLLVIRNRALVGLKDAALNSHTHDQLEVISSVATKAIDGVREIAYDLRPYQLDKLGLISTSVHYA
jgi:signal transduction histidine kinase